MKNLITTGFTFDPDHNHLDFSGVDGFDFRRLLYIYNDTTCQFLYIKADVPRVITPASPGTTLIQLSTSCTGMSSDDILSVLYLFEDNPNTTEDAMNWLQKIYFVSGGTENAPAGATLISESNVITDADLVEAILWNEIFVDGTTLIIADPKKLINFNNVTGTIDFTNYGTLFPDSIISIKYRK